MKAQILLIPLLYVAQVFGQINIDDPLTGPSLNTSLWSFEANAPGNGSISFDATRGIVLTLQPGIAARGIGSTCSLAGDFDVQVGITLINWPAQNLYGLRLGAVDLGSGPFGEVGIYREGGGEFYTVAFTSGSVHTATTNSDRISALRLKRVGSALSGYFLSGGVWVQVGGSSGTGSTTTIPTRLNLDISSSNPSAGGVTVAFNSFHVNSSSPLCAPTGLHATVGSQTVDLVWDPSRVPVDSYKIYRDECASCSPDTTVNLVTTTVAGTQQTFTSSNLVNGQLYRYTVTALKNGMESFHSNFVIGRPNEFAVSQPPPIPPNPILFLHGFGSGSFTWTDTANFLANTLHWIYGGNLSYSSPAFPFPELIDPTTTPPKVPQGCCSQANFFTVDFGNPFANYLVGNLGVSHQADEVQGFLLALRIGGVTQKVTLIGHSMGGMAARKYIADHRTDIRKLASQLITYGSPHWGVSAIAVRAILPFTASQGALDLGVGCTSLVGGHLLYPPGGFLDQLRVVGLPTDIQYFAIRGHNDFPFSNELKPCLSQQWDGLITIDSSSFAVPALPPTGQLPITNSPVPLLTTDREGSRGQFHLHEVRSPLP